MRMLVCPCSIKKKIPLRLECQLSLPSSKRDSFGPSSVVYRSLLDKIQWQMLMISLVWYYQPLLLKEQIYHITNFSIPLLYKSLFLEGRFWRTISSFRRILSSAVIYRFLRVQLRVLTKQNIRPTGMIIETNFCSRSVLTHCIYCDNKGKSIHS